MQSSSDGMLFDPAAADDLDAGVTVAEGKRRRLEGGEQMRGDVVRSSSMSSMPSSPAAVIGVRASIVPPVTALPPLATVTARQSPLWQVSAAGMYIVSSIATWCLTVGGVKL